MSLETLLEAAKYLEYRTEAKGRGEEPHDYGTYAQLTNGGDDEVTYSPDTSPSNQSDDLKERRRALGVGTREVHNKLEKNRRAHLKDCFEMLKRQIPSMDDKKTSNLSILRSALRYIQTLKRKEREYEHEMERLAREKIAQQQRLATLKKELAFLQPDYVETNSVYLEQEADNDTNSTSTASECGPISDDEEKLESSQPSSEATTNASLSPSPKIVAAVATVTTVPQSHTVQVPVVTAPSSVVLPPPPPTSASPRPITFATYASNPATPLAKTVTVTAPQLPAPTFHHTSNPTTIHVPTSALQTIAVSKATAAALSMNSFTTQANLPTHLQIPTQVMSRHGIQVNGNTGVITHPATVQVIAPQGVRVISGPGVGTSMSNTIPAAMNAGSSLTNTVGAAFATTVNVVTPKMVPNNTLAPVTIATVGKATNIQTVALTKPSLLPVTMTTALVTKPNPPMVSQPLTQAKGLMATVPKTMPIPIQIPIKATGVPTLSIPTSLATLQRTMTLQASQSPSQGVMSLTTIGGATLAASGLTAGTIQMGTANFKPGTQILQQTLGGHRAVLPHTIHAQGGTLTSNVNNLSRVLTTMKPIVRAPLTQITHVLQPTPIQSVGQLVTPGTHHVSTMGPLMASMMNHTAVSQVIAPPHLGKVAVAASPMLKSVGQIPLVQSQFLQQPQMKPIVVVTTPSVANSVVAATVVTAAQPQVGQPSVQVTLSGSH